MKMTEHRTSGVISPDTEHRLLAHGCRRVLVVVPSVAVGTRFTDVLPLVEADHRVSVAFTAAPITSGAARRGIEEFLRALAFLVLPWQEAIRQDFDLVLAADS